jgi:hypothetical protein
MGIPTTKIEQTPEREGARLLALVVAVATVILRLLQLLPNFSPVGGLSLFSGGRLRLWQALALSVLVMLVSDTVLGYYLGAVFTYASFMLYVLIGRLLCRADSPWRIGVGCLLGSLQFYLITNFMVWYYWPTEYAPTWAGLMQCYWAGVPFFGKTLAGDILYTTSLFGLRWALSRVNFPGKRAPVRMRKER